MDQENKFFGWWTGEGRTLSEFCSSHLEGLAWDGNHVWCATQNGVLVCALPIFDGGHEVVYAYGLEVAESVRGKRIVLEFLQSLCEEMRRQKKRGIIFETSNAELAVYVQKSLHAEPVGVGWGMVKIFVF